MILKESGENIVVDKQLYSIGLHHVKKLHFIYSWLLLLLMWLFVFNILWNESLTYNLSSWINNLLTIILEYEKKCELT